MKPESKPVLLILLAWLCLALALGVSGRFENASAPIVAATVWGLTALALLLCWRSQIIRAGVRALDLHWLIAIHLVRFVGFDFLTLGNQGALPLGFARPAGMGDSVIAIGAVLLLLAGRARRSRGLLLIWNGLGLLDIVFVVFSALRFGLHDSHSMAPLRALPLSLLPTFLVPLIIVSHILIFVRVRLAFAKNVT